MAGAAAGMGMDCLGERQFRQRIGFARYVAAASSQYLRLFDQFARTRQVAGVRWDFVNRQALTLQAAKSHTLQGHYSDVRLQWSAAFF